MSQERHIDPNRDASGRVDEQESRPRRRRGLGRGLDALLSSTAMPVDTGSEAGVDATTRDAGQAQPGGVRTLSPAAISPNPHQPRASFDEVALDELAASIVEHGILQPLIVTEQPEKPGRFWLVAGERRWRAARRAGLAQVPVIVREATSQQLLEWALVENVQRADLNPLEEAAAYRSLMDEFGLTQAQVAERVGRSRPAVANAVRLLELPLAVQQALTADEISAGHAKALLALKDADQMITGLHLVRRRELTVRQTEELVRQMLAPEPEPAPAPEPDPAIATYLRSLETRFQDTLGTKVNLNRRDDGSGRLVVHFYSDEDLESIYRQILGEDGE